MKKQICDVLYKALLILLVIQIILGIHWIIGSLGTHIGLTVQQGGYLYVLMTPFLSRMGDFFFIFQTVIFLTVLDYFLQSIWQRTLWLRCLRVLGVATCPGILLTLFTVNPYGVSAIALLLMLTLCTKIGKGEASPGRSLLFGTILLLVSPLWLQECFLLGTPLYLVLVILCYRSRETDKGMRRAVSYVALFGMTVALSFGFVVLPQDSEQRSQDMKPISEGLFVRVSRQNINKVYGNYLPEARDLLEGETLGQVAEKPELTYEKVIRPVKENYGQRKGTAILLHMAGCIWEGYKREVMLNTAFDFLSYLAPPVMVAYQLQGHGENALLRRLQEYALLPSLRAQHALLYLNAAVFVLGAIGFLLSVKEKRTLLIGLLCFAIFFSLWYTMQGERMDVRKCILLIAIEMGTFVSAMHKSDAKMEKL